MRPGAWSPRNLGDGSDAARLLAATARRAAIRLRCARGLEAMAWVQAAGVAALLAVSVVRIVLPVDLAIPRLLAAVLLGGAAAGGVYGWMRPISALAAARVLDRRARLGERVSTALELTAPNRTCLFTRLLVTDAAAHLAGVEVARLIPLRFPRRLLWVGAGALVLLLWGRMSAGVTLPGTPARQVVQTIRQEGQRLEREAQQRVARARAERLPETGRLAAQAQQLGARLRRERVDRGEALARVQDLTRQADVARQRLAERLARDQGMPSPERTSAPAPSSFARRQVVERQIRQIQELASQLRQRDLTAEGREDLLQRLDNLSRNDGEGNAPAQVARRAAEARQQLRQGNVAAAGQVMDEALADLEGMRRLLADEEGLAQAQQQLGQSAERIARGTPSGPGPQTAERDGQPVSRPSPAPGDNAPSPQEGKEDVTPPQGPHPGTTPGQGRVADKLGDPTARLREPKEQSRLRGRQGEGEVISGEVLAAGRRTPAQVRVQSVSAAAIREADRHMERSAVPVEYREIVRKYFERLSTLGGGR